MTLLTPPKAIQVPWGAQGPTGYYATNRMLRYVTPSHVTQGYAILRDNLVFKARMKITDFEKGRSAAGWELKSEGTGHEFYMFMSDFLALLELVEIKQAQVGENFYTFHKKGANYGVRLATAEEIEWWRQNKGEPDEL